VSASRNAVLAEDWRLEEIAKEARVETRSMSFVDSDVFRAKKLDNFLYQSLDFCACFWAQIRSEARLK
jgi:hypothetical protein